MKTIISIVFFFLIGVQLRAQSPAPIYAGADTTICMGSLVTLSATNPLGVPISWDNGIVDGIPFASNITLDYIVTADNLGVLSRDTVTVYVNESPVIGFTASLLYGCTRLTTTFTSTTTSGVANEVWNIESVGILSGSTVYPIFTQAGIFDVTLTVTGNNGCTSSLTFQDYVYTEDCLGIDEISIENKKVIRYLDITGREVPFKSNTFLIYIYDDGTAERVFKLEE